MRATPRGHRRDEGGAWPLPKTTADAIYAAYKAGTSLEDAAAEYESTATYASSDSFSYSSSVLGEWLYDDARQAGDSAVLEDSDSSNYYVVVFNGRSRNEYNTVNVRHILIQPEASELSEDDEGYEDDVAAKERRGRAEGPGTSWTSGRPATPLRTPLPRWPMSTPRIPGPTPPAVCMSRSIRARW